MRGAVFWTSSKRARGSVGEPSDSPVQRTDAGRSAWPLGIVVHNECPGQHGRTHRERV